MRLVLIVLALLAVPGGSPAPGKAFTIADSGVATGLAPGGAVTRKVRVTNPNKVDMVVTRLTAAVGQPSPACPATAVTALPYTTAFVVKGGASAEVPLTVRMAPTAPDSCKNLVFPLTYSGTATKP